MTRWPVDPLTFSKKNPSRAIPRSTYIHPPSLAKIGQRTSEEIGNKQTDRQTDKRCSIYSMISGLCLWHHPIYKQMPLTSKIYIWQVCLCITHFLVSKCLVQVAEVETLHMSATIKLSTVSAVLDEKSTELCSLCKKASNHYANLPPEIYSFTLSPPGKHLEATGADDPTLWFCPSASEGDNQSVGSSAPVASRCFPGGYNVKLYISRGRLAWWLLAFLCCGFTNKWRIKDHHCIENRRMIFRSKHTS